MHAIRASTTVVTWLESLAVMWFEDLLSLA